MVFKTDEDMSLDKYWEKHCISIAKDRRWAIQKGISVIPKSTHPERIASNARIFDFTIDQEDMELLDTLNQNYHSASIPEDLRDIVF